MNDRLTPSNLVEQSSAVTAIGAALAVLLAGRKSKSVRVPRKAVEAVKREAPTLHIEWVGPDTFEVRLIEDNGGREGVFYQAVR